MDDLAPIDAPNCPTCLTQCTAVGIGSHAYWACSTCRMPILSNWKVD